MNSEPQNFGIILVPDNAVDEFMVRMEVIAANFIGNSKEEKQGTIVVTAIFLVIIYGGYFIVTYLCSKNIIKEK